MADNIYNSLNKSLYKIELKSPSYEIAADQIASGSLLATFNQVMETMQSGKTHFDNTETGYILGLEEGTAKFYIGDSTSYLNWTGSALNISGTLTAGAIAIGTNAWHVDSSGNMWWGSSTTYSGATIKISSAGAVNFTTGTFSGSLGSGISISAPVITGGTIQTASSGNRIKLNGSNSHLEFLVNDTVYASMYVYVPGGGQNGVIMTTISGDSFIAVTEGTTNIASIYAGSGYLTINESASKVYTNFSLDVGGDLYMNDNTITNITNIFFTSRSTDVAVDGQFAYYNTGGVQELQIYMAGYGYSCDLTFL